MKRRRPPHGNDVLSPYDDDRCSAGNPVQSLVLWMAYIIVNNNIYKIVYKNELRIKYGGRTALLYVELCGDGSGMFFFSAAWP